MILTSIYPKSNGCAVTFGEYNCVKCGTDYAINALNTELENSMNIARLQFTCCLIDIPHDYMIVDSFTDSSGYNDTINVNCSTTSTYCNTGVNGYYSNLSINQTIYPCTLYCCVHPVTDNGGGGVDYSSATISCYGANTHADTSLGTTSHSDVIVCTCILNQCSLSGVPYFCYCLTCYFCTRCYIYSCGYYKICITNSQDNIYLTCANTSYGNSVTNCYAYCCVSTGCYNFCCNGVCKCQVGISTIPNITICLHTFVCSIGGGHLAQDAIVCLCNLIYGFQTKILTNNITYANPAKMIYYTEEAYGTGTRVYNVIDASTGCCIETNLPVNCMCLLSCCVCCHRYEIIQCNNAVSCIKSYAIAVGI